MLGELDGQLPVVDSVIDRLVPADDTIRDIRKHLDQAIKNEDYVDLYTSGKGRPSFPPAMMVKAMLWQFAEELSDRDLESAIRYDLRVKFLLGLHVEDKGPDATTFVVFRRRLMESHKAKAAFEAVRDLAVRMQLLKVVGGTGLVDATQILSRGEVPTIAGLVQQGIRKGR